MRISRLLLVCLGSCASVANALTVDRFGRGDMLIYPYYTVNNAQTLLSVVNSTGHGKALKVRFREGYNGREVANFNLYLGPYDTWVGAVFDASADGKGGAGIATNDTSCVVPAFHTDVLPAGVPAIRFNNGNYTQGVYGAVSGLDSGPTDLSRTREGFLEVIEMGEVVDQASGSQKTLEAITPVTLPDFQVRPLSCQQVIDAWSPGGYWSQNPQVDLSPPAGGLYGIASIVNVAQGTIYASEATALNGFSDVVQNTGPDHANPNLGTAVTNSQTGVVTAFLSVRNTMVAADYPSSRAVDAVSALLAADRLYDEVDGEPALGASTDWLLAFPTRQFYVDPGIVGTTPTSYLAPFEETFGGGLHNGAVVDPGDSCVVLDLNFHDRNGLAPGPCCDPPPAPVPDLACYQTSVIGFFSAIGEPTRVLNSNLASDNPGSFTGQLAIGFNTDAPIAARPILRPSTNDVVVNGLPVIGFAAINYINANVTPGVLANYSAVYPLRASASCTKSQQPC